MTEQLLQFIWSFGYFNKSSLQTTEGDVITIQSPGFLNKNQGPDFANARVIISDTIFAGSIELHLKTSDWIRHSHQNDAHYKNVILHVVFTHDEAINTIPVLELQPRISTLLLESYRSFMHSANFIACGNSITTVKALTWLSWKERLLAERLQRKSTTILNLLNASGNHWEEVLWWMLARNFGGKINGDAFESVARSVPINIIAKCKTSHIQLEALLLGQAGLLAGDFDEEYPALLKREHQFLQKKYSLQPSLLPMLFLRMRPGNFPTIRLAQLATLVYQSQHLFSKILDAVNVFDVKELFKVTANDFWHYHYTFRQSSPFKKKVLGEDMIESIIINTAVPVVFAYGLYHRSEKHTNKALRWLEELAPESNAITKGFASLNISNNSAYDSQALIELKNEYCGYKKCLQCSIGNTILRETAAKYKTNHLET